MISWKDYFGNSLDPEDDDESGWENTHDYSFGRKLLDDPEETEEREKKELADAIKSHDFIKALKKIKEIGDRKDRRKEEEKKRSQEASKPVSDFEKTGIWRGYSYYAPPRLDARYIEQMANALAARYNIEVKVGDGWKIDLKNKVLVYDPTTLIDATKGRMLAALLHEIGHLRHTTIGSELKSEYLTKYEDPAHHVINLFEDLRIDKIMSKSYASAEDIYEENKPIVREIALGYAEKSQYIKDVAEKHATHHLMEQYGIEGYVSLKITGDKEIYVTDALKSKLAPPEMLARHNELKERRKKLLGSEELTPDVVARIKVMYESLLNMDTLEDYSAGILLTGYGEALPTLPPRMTGRITKTKGVIPDVEKAGSTQDVLDVLDKSVFPVIEDLLKKDEQMQEILKDIFGGLAEDIAKDINESSNYGSKGQAAETDGKMEPRDSGSNRGEDVPPEWVQGDYEPLKQSIKTEADRLSRRLKLLKKEEEQPVVTQNHKRGKLSSKNLHRFATGGTRLFKRKEDGLVQTDAHAFSVVIDTSGSMYDDKGTIVHATRATILFAEVFKQIGIPFEVIGFDSRAKTFKEFDAPFSKPEMKTLAGIPARSGGGSTNLDHAFRQSKIIKNAKKNKTMVIISDGGIGDFGYYESYKRALNDANVNLIGISINSGPAIVKFCGSGYDIRKVAQLPDVFSKIIRETFKGGKKRNF